MFKMYDRLERRQGSEHSSFFSCYCNFLTVAVNVSVDVLIIGRSLGLIPGLKDRDISCYFELLLFTWFNDHRSCLLFSVLDLLCVKYSINVIF